MRDGAIYRLSVTFGGALAAFAVLSGQPALAFEVLHADAVLQTLEPEDSIGLGQIDQELQMLRDAWRDAAARTGYETVRSLIEPNAAPRPDEESIIGTWRCRSVYVYDTGSSLERKQPALWQDCYIWRDGNRLRFEKPRDNVRIHAELAKADYGWLLLGGQYVGLEEELDYVRRKGRTYPGNIIPPTNLVGRLESLGPDRMRLVEANSRFGATVPPDLDSSLFFLELEGPPGPLPDNLPAWGMPMR